MAAMGGVIATTGIMASASAVAIALDQGRRRDVIDT
jgi:hypothetical protein